MGELAYGLRSLTINYTEWGPGLDSPGLGSLAISEAGALS